MLRRRKKIKRRDYNRKRHHNPFFPKNSRQKSALLKKDFSWKARLIALLVALLGLFGVYLLFYSPLFKISKVEINGIEELPKADLEKLIWQQINSSILILAPQTNIFLFNKDRLAQKLEENHSFEYLNIDKNFYSKSITISLKEKKYSLVWLEDDKYYYASADGAIITEINPLEIAMQNWPIIENLTNKKISDKIITGGSEEINFALQIFQILNKDNPQNLNPEKFVLEQNEINYLKMVLRDGPAIIFNTKEAPAGELNRLYVLIKGKLKDDFRNKQYIILRFGDKIYYQ